jgi:hypothetical protein
MSLFELALWHRDQGEFVEMERLLRKASDLGYVEAQVQLAQSVRDGLFGDASAAGKKNEVHKLNTISAVVGGDPLSQFNLAISYQVRLCIFLIKTQFGLLAPVEVFLFLHNRR